MKISKRAISTALLLGLSLSPSIVNAQTIDFLSVGSTAYYGGVPTNSSTPVPIFSTNANTLTTTFNGPVIMPGSLGIGIGANIPHAMVETQTLGSYAYTEFGGNGLETDTGYTTSDYALYMGADKSNRLSYIQSVEWGANLAPLVLNARGGYVGIGTATPNAALHVNGDIRIPHGNMLRLGDTNTSSDGGGGEGIHDTSTDGSTNFGLALTTGFIDRLVITAAGNVGIGTTEPGSTLQVNSGDNFMTFTTENNPGSPNASVLRVNNNLDSVVAALDVGNNAQHWQFRTDANQNNSLIIFDATRIAPRLVINTTGFVGINSSAPQTTLDVNGPIKLGSTFLTMIGPLSITINSGCAPEGAMGYDAGNHIPVYCNHSGVWHAFYN